MTDREKLNDLVSIVMDMKSECDKYTEQEVSSRNLVYRTLNVLEDLIDIVIDLYPKRMTNEHAN